MKYLKIKLIDLKNRDNSVNSVILLLMKLTMIFSLNFSNGFQEEIKLSLKSKYDLFFHMNLHLDVNQNIALSWNCIVI